MSYRQAIKELKRYQGKSLTSNLAEMENNIIGANNIEAKEYCEAREINSTFLESALLIKQIAGEINVIMHSAAIMHALQFILKSGEVVECVSLGAGNTGKKFDLETNFQVAEFKLIDWKGGSETIRKNNLFKDFYNLAEHETDKERNMYVVDTHYPLKFFNGRRAITSVLSKQPIILDAINKKYGSKVTVTKDYFELHKHKVNLIDVSPYIGRT